MSPTAIGEDLTATWTVIVTNPASAPSAQEDVSVVIASYPPLEGQIVSLPAGCRAISAQQSACTIVLGAGERREFQFRVQFNRRHGIVQVDASFGTGPIRAFATNLFPRLFAVSSTADSGPGSLRQAILDINQTCAEPFEPCGPAFRLDGPAPVEGWFTIRPSSPLPPLTAPYVVVDGRSQTLHTGNTNPAGPEIMLDGSSNSSGHGLEYNGSHLRVTDMAIGNFPGNGINSAATDQTIIERCHLGMNPAGTGRAPNGTRGAQIAGGRITVTDSLLAGNFRSGGWFETVRGLLLTRNRFTDNGASGFYARTPLAPPGNTNFVQVEQNVISGNAHAGISLDRASVGNYAQNTFLGNLGRAIDIGIDGPTLAVVPGLPGGGGIVGAPAIVSARYENGETILVARIAPRSGTNVFAAETVYFYANPAAKDGGELLGAGTTESHGNELFTLRVPRDLRGQRVSAATFMTYIYNFDDTAPGTSEVGMPRLVE
ncbi:MAG TPA: right-handed parallel beta-helix repeat-containing protein [Thermoanaerobaculia bacterium]